MTLTAGLLIGGIGLFLLAVKMITDGLRLAVGEGLRGMLGDRSRSPARGISSGVAITSLAQSSSAVTVAVIGFINAGLLTLYQALGVVYGAGIGATMTGWLVAVTGYGARVELFALPMVGAGMLLYLTGPRRRRGALGEALAGFGLLFIGIEVLREGFGSMPGGIDLQQLLPDGIGGMLLLVGIGFAMTVLVQSSSAVIALILTAASAALLSFHAAAVLLVGASTGTAATAALAAIRATPAARRVALAQLLFNLFSGALALTLLPIVPWLLQRSAQVLQLQLTPAVSLALFYTLFSLLAVLLLWPLTRRLGAWLERRFQTGEDVAGRPQYLDRNVAETPALAVRALALELCRLSALACSTATHMVTEPKRTAGQLGGERDSAQRLALAMGEFVARLQRGRLSGAVAGRLAQVLRAAGSFVSAADSARDVVSYSGVAGSVGESELPQMLKEYRTSIARFLFRADPYAPGFGSDDLEHNMESIVLSYQPLQRAVLIAGANSQLRITELGMLLEYIRGLRNIVEQVGQGSRDIADLLGATGGRGAGDSALSNTAPEPAQRERQRLPEPVDSEGNGAGDQEWPEAASEQAETGSSGAGHTSR